MVHSLLVHAVVVSLVSTPGGAPRPPVQGPSPSVERISNNVSSTLDTSEFDPAPGPSTCTANGPASARTSGPDLIVGHVFNCQPLGRVGPAGSGITGMSCWTTACTKGDMGTNWFGLPSVDHPMISVNMFRLWRRDGSDRLEQIGQGWIKHGFGTENADDCGFGCNPDEGHFNLNAPGCSDTYAASQFQACDLGPRSMIHPYTGVMPSGADMGDSGGCAVNYPANDHRDHVHDEISHRVQVPDADLFPTLNVGARYLVEGQYLTPHEYVAGNGTQNNNASYRNVHVAGPDSCDQIVFRDRGATFAEQPAVSAWPGAAQTLVEPAPLVDGRGFLVYKVTNLGNVWRYDYALYNMNMDRAMGSFSVPLPAGAVVSNIGFHAPLNHAPEPDPTTQNYSNTAWAVSTVGGAITWSTASSGVDPFANAVRWGTAYNFYFDANTPPASVSATVGLFKTGGTVTAATLGPSAGPVDCNGNSISDSTDVDNCTGDPACADCNGNLVPDGCEPDCNGNGAADRCDIASAFSIDCDGDAIPDECEPFLDCNGNLVSDDCEVYADPSLDGNRDGIPDPCGTTAPRVWFVDDDAPGDPLPGSPDGSNPFENGSIAYPFDAIQEAVDAARTGDTIIVRDGAYSGVGNHSIGVFDKSITVRSQNGPQSCIVDLQQANPFVLLSGEIHRHSDIEGFQMINLWPEPGAPSAVDAGTRVTVAHCKFVGSSPTGTSAIRIAPFTEATITGCSFHNVRFPIRTSSARSLIANCLISGGFYGIDIQGGNGTTTCVGSSVSRIVNTTVTGAFVGTSFSPATFATIENSIVWGNSNSQILATGASLGVTYSDVQGGWPGVGNINVDPQFRSPAGGDYRLADGSPCIDAGNSAAMNLPSTDFEGGARQFDRPGTVDTGAGTPPIVDMGADEWNDCNGNGVDDSVDIDQLTSADCNGNRVPDSCEPFEDCNANTVRDSCDIFNDGDCNANAIPDDCDVLQGAEDCDGNLLPDECQPDCQPNAIADSCDIADAASEDCDEDGVPDECVPFADCNGNTIRDSCDIFSGSSPDLNGNGVPDECDPTPPVAMSPRKNRSLSVTVTPASVAGPAATALRVTMLDLQDPIPANATCCPPPDFSAFEAGAGCADPIGCVRWAGPPGTFLESQDDPTVGAYRASRLQCTPYYGDWTGAGEFHITGAEIMPSSTYQLENLAAACMGNESTCAFASSAVVMQTARAGDIFAPFNPPDASTQPEGVDVAAAVNKFKSLPGAARKAIAQVQPNAPNPNADLDALDIAAIVNNVKGFAYPYSGPCVCPSMVRCNVTACASASACAGTYGAGSMCVRTCTSGPRTGEPCTRDLHCGACSAGSANPGLPCDAVDDCAGGTCDLGDCPPDPPAAAGFCRDRCGRCSP